ncbi:MAG: hypothetical protein WD398_06085 [Cyclobacteriaceae bacterium]
MQSIKIAFFTAFSLIWVQTLILNFLESRNGTALYDFQQIATYQNKIRYRHLLSRPVITEYYIVGMNVSTFNDGGFWLFARKSGKLISKNVNMESYTFKNIYRPLSVLHEKAIVSHMIPEALTMEKTFRTFPKTYRTILRTRVMG